MVFVGGASQYTQDAILDSEDMRKLFVTKIPVDANDEDVKSFLEAKAGGQITEHVVIHKENARSHFGFFTFAHSSMLDEVIFKEKELIFNNSTLEVNRAVPKEHYLTGAHHKAKKLFIANLPKTGVSEEEMKKYFEDRHNPRYGIIEKVEFIKKKDEAGNRLEENKGFGFITVSSEHFADTLAIQYAKFDFGGQRIELKKSDKENTTPGGRGGGGRGGGRGGGARGGNRGGGGGGQYGGGGSGYGGYGGGYDSYGYDAYNSGYNQWDYYGGYDMTYPQYGVSSSQTSGARGGGGMSERGGSRGGGRGGAKTDRGGRGGRGGKSDRGSSRGGGGGGGGRGGQRGGKRFAPYSKMR